ncbi:MAG: MerR family transcriptional regulator [Streptosporangiales bacterium]|nr:MerR family transcriptional regulator [Streptosporangiales bacterium]
MSAYRISQLAERTGVPASTLRYYESTGLLPAERSPAGYRLYDEPAIERLGFIGTAKRLGLPLEEIAELLHVWENGACVQVKTDLRPRLQARLAEAQQRGAEVAAFIASLRAALAHLDALPDRSGRCDPNCGFLTLAADGPAAQPGVDESPRERWRDAPVACSLTADDIGERAQQWHDVLAGAVQGSIPDGLRFTVPVQRLAKVAELAAAEQTCCPFFDFRLHLDGPHLHVQIRASVDGQPMLGALFDPPVS